MAPEWMPEDYREAEFIGRGGEAEVWRARRHRCGTAVAIKRYFPGARVSFYREIAVLSTLRHPNIVPFVAFHDGVGGEKLVVTEFCPGGSLRSFLEANGEMKEDQALDVLHQCALGLQAIHGAGLLHGDVKPENVLLDRRWRKGVWKLADFGLTRSARNTARQRSFTPAYAAPEAVAGHAVPASDIHSLGAVAMELFEPLASTAAGQRVRELATECVREAPAERPMIDEVLRRITEIRGAELLQRYAPEEAAEVPA